MRHPWPSRPPYNQWPGWLRCQPLQHTTLLHRRSVQPIARKPDTLEPHRRLPALDYARNQQPPSLAACPPRTSSHEQHRLATKLGRRPCPRRLSVGPWQTRQLAGGGLGLMAATACNAAPAAIPGRCPCCIRSLHWQQGEHHRHDLHISPVFASPQRTHHACASCSAVLRHLQVRCLLSWRAVLLPHLHQRQDPAPYRLMPCHHTAWRGTSHPQSCQ
mmetsp:Transcript_34590/g.79100  ORF Transcript_34590/g.79100 Transcript_34590/m.79100 type:complete len:217 (+) Transcript_34590:2627-3277(+)